MSESVFLSPKSIAVVGASDKQGSVGRAITSNYEWLQRNSLSY